MRGALLFPLLAGFAILATGQKNSSPPIRGQETPGCMQMVAPDGKAMGLCPLKQTDVQADIAGYGARVTVKQTFTNPSKAPIEAIYTFPLPHDAAVDRMSLRMGDRVINATIKKREEARQIYEAAKNLGRVAGLLDQQRPNIFTQSVANIMPGATIEVEISYVQILEFKDDQFEFVFPMVVGPRYLGNAPDPTKISPPTAAPGVRVGTDITLKVNLNAGAQLNELKSVLHQVNTQKTGANTATVTLAKKDEIPNRDFILRYSVANNQVQDAFLTYADAQKGGFFSLILNPPKVPAPDQIAPKEVVFVMDQSGSQNGFPLEKSKELTKKLIRTLNPDDTFTVVAFSNGVKHLWTTPRKASDEAISVADKFVQDLQANGGTNLYSGVQAALDVPVDPERLRLIVFNTDGFVGDEARIIGSIEARSKTSRMFTFGIGNSVNRFLIDEMSRAGRGDSETVTLEADTDKTVERFIQRTQNPILTDIQVKVEGVPVYEMTPRGIQDVFSSKPVVVTGRYSQPGRGSITITGKLGGESWSRVIPVTFPAQDKDGSSIATLWARRRVADLQGAMAMAGWQNKDTKPFVNEITNTGLRYGIMTEYTSFVAVEQRIVNVGGKQRTVDVPVNMADGVKMGDKEKADGLYRGRNTLSGGQGLVNMGGAGGGPGGGGGLTTGGSTGTTTGGTTAATKAPTGMTFGLNSAEAQRFISYDPVDNSIVLDQKFDLRKTMKEQPDILPLIAESAKPAELAKHLAKLTPAEQEQFWFLARVSKELRAMKAGTKSVVWITCTPEEAASLSQSLTGSAVIDHPTVTGKKMIIAELDVARLKSIAQRKGVSLIVKGN